MLNDLVIHLAIIVATPFLASLIMLGIEMIFNSICDKIDDKKRENQKQK